ncbi:SDR family NAD(P)-dependent oxidoreductase [Aestuariivirga sp.]|uniref:SDR family NAD(P)-dependent oxidoreductase n=1 Tax=Aestuariivirga sp. TaxID=2650926 RepID=UPI0035945CFC
MDVAIITGGTRGIGAAIATALAHRKVRLVLNGRTEDAEVTALVAELGKVTETVFMAGDASEPEMAAALVKEATARFGRIDYVVPAAGGPNPGKITDLSFDQWAEAFRVHVDAVFHLFRAAQPALAVRGGGFLMIGSVAGKRGCPSTVAYQTAKGALPQMARALARDHAAEGIRVNVIEPGIIRTRFHAAMTAEAERNNLDNRIPLRRFGTPDNVASAALELLTNPFITGETLTIDGGMSMRMV